MPTESCIEPLLTYPANESVYISIMLTYQNLFAYQVKGIIITCCLMLVNITEDLIWSCLSLKGRKCNELCVVVTRHHAIKIKQDQN